MRNLREPLEILLSLPDYIRESAKIRNEFNAIEVIMNMCRGSLDDYNYDIVLFDGVIDVLMRIG